MATREMGKPLVDSRAEVEKCAWACEWFADHGPRMLEPEVIETEAMFANSLSIIEACGLTHLHVFPFSPRTGTPGRRSDH